MKKILTMAAVSAVALSAADASRLAVGQGDGLNTLNHNGTAYAAGTFSASDPGVVDIAVVAGGVHVMSSTGLTYYDYNPTTDAFTRGGNFSWGADTATAVAVAADGSLFAGGSSGFGHFIYSGGSYAVDNWQNSNVGDIAIDQSGHIHVAQTDGLSGWSYSAGLLSNTAWDAGWAGGNAIAIDSGGMLHVGKGDGLGDLVYNGSSYAFNGHWSAGAGITDLAIDEVNGQIWATQGDGVQVVNQSTYALDAWGAQAGGFDAVLVDSDGEVHLGKSDGMGSYDISGADVVYDGSSWYGMANGVTAMAEVIPEPATLGLLGLAGGALLFARRKFMI